MAVVGSPCRRRRPSIWQIHCHHHAAARRAQCFFCAEPLLQPSARPPLYRRRRRRHRRIRLPGVRAQRPPVQLISHRYFSLADRPPSSPLLQPGPQTRHVGIVDSDAQAQRLETLSAHSLAQQNSHSWCSHRELACGPCRCSRERRLDPAPCHPPTSPGGQGPPCRTPLAVPQVRKSI